MLSALIYIQIFGFKCKKIGPLVNDRCKQFKANLVLKMNKLGLFLRLLLSQDLDFLDLTKFLLFNLGDFLFFD